MIRAAAVSKHLGISPAQLREIISEVNFGIKPADREFPEIIANGIIRVAEKKFKKKVGPIVSFSEKKVIEELKTEEENAFEKLSKLVKKSKQNVTEKKIEEKNEKESKDKKKSEKNKFAPPAVFRKIEVNQEEAEKKKIQIEFEQKSKKEKEEELLEKKVMLRKKKNQPKLVKKTGIVEIPEFVSIKEFSEKVGVPASEIIASLMKNGVMTTINKTLDFETFQIIADELEIKIKMAEKNVQTEDLKERNLEKIINDENENLSLRAPIVVVMGHVDHGKTKILDAIRETKIADGEAGGITQKIGAYQVEKNDQKITFIDTPGHEAFTAMRARGAKTADIAILVVAADEGIKPQTMEAIAHAREANLPIIVAINKIDKENANIEKIKGELAKENLIAEDFGGKTITVAVSALQKKGIDDLLEMILLQAEMLDLKANPNRLSVGTIIESHLDNSLGPVATILINTGTLKIGDSFILGENAGKIKTMVNDVGKKIKKAEPSYPAQISGMSKVPEVGEILQVFSSAKIARQKAEEIKNLSAEERSRTTGIGIGEIMSGITSGKIKFLKIVLKTDNQGSLEAVQQSIEKIKHDEVRPKIIYSSAGAVTESDVMMAAASNGMIVGFNVAVSSRISKMAEKENVEIQNFQVIYHLTEMIEKVLSGMLVAEKIEVEIGKMIAKKVFYSKKKLMIIGCQITEGFVENLSNINIFRKAEQVGKGKIAVLQHFEKKVQKIDSPNECGIQFDGNFKVEPGDELQVLKIEDKLKTLHSSK